MSDILVDKQRERNIFKVTIVGAIVNFLLIVYKFVAGILGHSAAMIADAMHSVSDFITDIVVIVCVRIANKPKDREHSYGHGKFETLATLIIGFVLLLVGLGIGWSSIGIIWDVVIEGKQLRSPGMIALVAAFVSVISKEVLYWYTAIWGRKLKSPVVVANAWHHRSDAWSSVASILGIGGAILLGNKWTILDPLAALVVSIFIMKIAFGQIKPAVDELMERSLPEEVENEILKIVAGFSKVGQLHNLHTRRIGTRYAIEFHVRMPGNITLSEAHQAVTEIEIKLKEVYGAATHVVIHMEPYK